ncbi:MAG TPA: AMP-binding protein, partial [Alphaproteobacteria bacterium]|nr:AMP-binding protein [Alphaproteobacteria bacterium]
MSAQSNPQSNAMSISVPNENPLKWQPSPETVAGANLTRFMQAVGVTGGYHDIWRWSVSEKEKFWSTVWDFCGVIGDKGDVVFKQGEKFQDSRFFPDAKLNFAENMLRRRDDAVAIVFKGEDKVERQITYADLYNKVSQLRQALIAEGVEKGDRVGGYLPNMPETIMA